MCMPAFTASAGGTTLRNHGDARVWWCRLAVATMPPGLTSPTAEGRPGASGVTTVRFDRVTAPCSAALDWYRCRSGHLMILLLQIRMVLGDDPADAGQRSPGRRRPVNANPRMDG